MAKKPSRVNFLGGHSGRKGLLGVLAFPEAYSPETEYTMCLTTLDGQWWQLQFPFDIASVTYLADPSRGYRGWWLAGKRGEVVEVSGGKPRIERIATAGTGPKNKLGHLAQIRVIDGALYCCGYRRQVYRREGADWTLISRDILAQRKRGPWNGFEAIDGFSGEDLYAVGDEGEIWHYDGASWSQCESPTTENLTDVRCLDDGKVWVCGDGGVVLRGDRNGWDVVWDNPEPSEAWWSLERFQGQVYVAGAEFLGRIEKNRIVPVETGVAGLTAQSLHHKDGTLWSIGAEHILAFDGSTWREVECPQNK